MLSVLLAAVARNGTQRRVSEGMRVVCGDGHRAENVDEEGRGGVATLRLPLAMGTTGQ